MITVTIYFDGGCGPTNPGNKYGSFEVMEGDRCLHRREAFQLGHGTNNEAEFESLLAALEWCSANLADPECRHLVMFSDSTILVNRILGRNRTRRSEPQQRMFNLAERCLQHLARFGGFEIHWQGRSHNLARFGH